MYIEITPDTEYTRLPATLLDGNNPIDYGTLDSLQLRYLDGGRTGSGSYKPNYTIDAAFMPYIYPDSLLQFNYTIPSSPCLAFFYINGLDNTKGCYLDGDSSLYDMPAYHVDGGDGIARLVDGNLPKAKAPCIVRTLDNRFINTSKIENLGCEAGEAYYKDAFYNSYLKTYPNTNGDWGPDFNIFSYNNILYVAYDKHSNLEVLINGNTMTMLTFDSPRVNIKLASARCTHNIFNGKTAEPSALFNGVHRPSQATMDTTDGLKKCIVIGESLDIMSCYFPKLGLRMFYLVDEGIWVDETSFITVGNPTGTHILDSVTGAMIPRDNIPTIIYDPGPLVSAYRYELVIPELANLPRASNGEITVAQTAARLKGLVNIDDKAYWCELTFKKRLCYIDLCVYSITSSILVPNNEVKAIKNRDLYPVEPFNRYLTDGVIC